MGDLITLRKSNFIANYGAGSIFDFRSDKASISAIVLLFDNWQYSRRIVEPTKPRFFISNEPDKSPIKPPEPASRLLLAKCMLNNAHDENKKIKKPKYLDKLLLSFVSCL